MATSRSSGLGSWLPATAVNSLSQFADKWIPEDTIPKLVKVAGPWVPAIATVAVAATAVALLFPTPKLDWENEVLPDARRFMKEKGVDVADEEKKPLKGLRIAVTGATAGIGMSLTRKLVQLGATVIVIGRSPSKLKKLQDEAPESIETIVADLTDLEAVAKAGDEMVKKYSHLDVLVNNAGLHTGVELWGSVPTKQNYDMTFGVNYLAHFLLTEKLLPILHKAEKPRIVQVSSAFHIGSDGSDLRTESAGREMPIASSVGGNHGFIFSRSQRQYANSKLAQIVHARALADRHPGVTCVSACPSWVGSEITGKAGTLKHLLFTSATFPVDGYGLSSILHAILDPPSLAGGLKRDFYTNTGFLGVAYSHKEKRPSRQYRRSLSYEYTPLRDVGVAFLAYFVLLPFQRFMPVRGPSACTPVSYDEILRNELYDWSRQAVSEWL